MYPERILKALQRAKINIQAGYPNIALEDLEKAVKKCPKGFEAWFLLGQAHGMMGNSSASEKCFLKAVACQPKNAEAWFNLGISYSARAMFTQAIDCYKKSIQFAQGIKVDAHHNLGSCYLSVDKFEDAASIFKELLKVHETADIRALLAISLQGKSDFQGAIREYELAIAKDTNNYTVNLNIGTCHFMMNDFEKSIEYTEYASITKPEDHVAKFNLARSYLEQGNIEKTLANLDQCELPVAQSTRLFALNYVDPYDPYIFLKQKITWKVDQLSSDLIARIAVSESKKPLRLGFVSGDLKHHPVSFFFEKLIENIDRSSLSIYFFSDVKTPDEVTSRFQQMACGWTDIYGLSDAQVSKQIRDHEIDILFDLGGHTSERIRLFSNRIAAVQASYLGYGATTMMPEIDYFLTDCKLDPIGLTDDHYTEKLCRLGDAFVTYLPPVNAPAVGLLPMLKNAYPVFGSFNKLTKITPSTLALWAKVLLAVPDSKMLLMAKGLETQSERTRIENAFFSHGVDPKCLDMRGASNFNDYLSAHNEVDLILDCFPWNSHTTAMHGLWMGVPTLTIRGQHHAGRFGELVLSNLQLDHWISKDEHEFIDKAKCITEDNSHLKILRSTARFLLEKSVHCDHEGLAARFKIACYQMWSNYCTNQLKSIYIENNNYV